MILEAANSKDAGTSIELDVWRPPGSKSYADCAQDHTGTFNHHLES